LPAARTLVKTCLGLVVPGLSFHFAGHRLLAKCVGAGCGVAVLVFLVWLGFPAANWTFMLIISAHVASVSQQIQPLMQTRRLATQIILGMVLFAAMSLLIYLPARNWFYEHAAMPLQTRGNVIVLDPRVGPDAIKCGDNVAYRIEGGYANGVVVRAGYGYGPVLAVPGDRVAFTANNCRVNGAPKPRLAHMPEAGELVVPEKCWFIWPDLDIYVHGVSEETVAQGMLKVALVDQNDFVGQLFKRWFFRKQISP